MPQQVNAKNTYFFTAKSRKNITQSMHIITGSIFFQSISGASLELSWNCIVNLNIIERAAALRHTDRRSLRF
jgi:hypothetical protein